jgi:hypothetical protein
MDVLKPRWTTATFLLYLGVFTVLGAMSSAYAYLADQYGDVAFVGWTLLMLAVLLALAVGSARRNWLVGGLFAYLAVAGFGTFVGALFAWWGWDGGGDNSNNAFFRGWHWLEWLVILIVLVATAFALRRTRFPLFVLSIAVLVWILVTDIVSGGGSWSAVVSLAIGFAYLVAAMTTNRVYGFWLHVASGLLIGGALLYWWHSTTTDWWLLAIAGFVFVRVGSILRRSSWAVLGAGGLLAAATHFSIDWTTGSFTFFQGPQRVWVPIVVSAVLGFLFVLLGLWAWRRDPLDGAAVPAVPVPAPVAPATAATPE